MILFLSFADSIPHNSDQPVFSPWLLSANLSLSFIYKTVILSPNKLMKLQHLKKDYRRGF